MSKRIQFLHAYNYYTAGRRIQLNSLVPQRFHD